MWAKIGEVQGPRTGVEDQRGEAVASLGEEGFGEVNGGGGAALGEGVEENVGVECWGTGNGGDAGEEGAALFARGSVGEITD